MASCNHYDRHLGESPAEPIDRIVFPLPLTPVTRHFPLKNELGPGVWSDRRYVMCMISQADKAQRFLDLHRPGEPLLMPNPWDLGSAKLLASLGFAALATTSSGFAATLGRNDGLVSRDEAMIHAAVIVAATDLPVSADLENAYADDPAGAAEAAHAGPVRLVLTARAENFIRGNPDLADTIARLQAYQEAGADVLYAPGLRNFEDISQVVREVDRPVNVLALDDTPPVAEMARAGVARISVGGGFAFAALGAVVAAATALREQGTYRWLAGAAAGAAAARRAFG